MLCTVSTWRRKKIPHLPRIYPSVLLSKKLAKIFAGESITTFSREGRLCSAPIHPQICQFHSNVSSKFCHQTHATIALMSHMRTRWLPSRNLVTTVRYEDDDNYWNNNFFRQNSGCRQRRSVAVVTRPDVEQGSILPAKAEKLLNLHGPRN